MFLLVGLVATSPARADWQEQAASLASRVDLDVRVVSALLIKESGLAQRGENAQPWPWAMNIDGRSHYYPTKEDATKAMTEALDSGAGSIDVGLGQVNLQMNRSLLREGENPFDIDVNLRMAGDVLTYCKGRERTLPGVLGCYHRGERSGSREGQEYAAQVLSIARERYAMAPSELGVESFNLASTPPDEGGMLQVINRLKGKSNERRQIRIL